MDKPLRTTRGNKILTIDESSDAGRESKGGQGKGLQEFRSCRSYRIGPIGMGFVGVKAAMNSTRFRFDNPISLLRSGLLLVVS